MDLEMPVLDGLGAMRQIRNRELTGEGLANTKEASKKSGERLPIIAVTANVRKEQIDTAIAAGAVRDKLIRNHIISC
jgi:CheY-like chemotaxis protein